MMNEAETGYTIEFDTLREINMWQIKHPEMCRGQHIVKWETWWKYSESIEKAWVLVEDMDAAGVEPCVLSPSSAVRDQVADWVVTRVGKDRIFRGMHGNTAPRAICAAWLAWKATP
jgi:hypothetical protein